MIQISPVCRYRGSFIHHTDTQKEYNSVKLGYYQGDSLDFLFCDFYFTLIFYSKHVSTFTK